MAGPTGVALPPHALPGAGFLAHPRCVVVTRPEPEATRWTQALRAHAWPALALPLIEIAAPDGGPTREVLQAWQAQWPTLDAVFFVSGAAVRHFFGGDSADRPVVDAGGPRFWAPGPGTEQALRDCGVPVERIDAPAADAPQFDSEALWSVVEGQLRPGYRVLIVRGHSETAAPLVASVQAGTGRDWLLRACEARGAEVQTCVAYVRRMPGPGPEQRRRMEEALAPGSLWLFSSSEALDHLVQALPGAVLGRCEALVTHPRIAERARAAGFGRIVETRPALPDVLGTLESVWSTS